MPARQRRPADGWLPLDDHEARSALERNILRYRATEATQVKRSA